ncbi:hypothetical protein VNO77_28504 [Canavalia gladiata]|uniref:Uncharacterized protein n=1 Tax=Canavalia gladiata TaxID=3824 RepID=A0AAN9KZC3_CANGL
MKEYCSEKRQRIGEAAAYVQVLLLHYDLMSCHCPCKEFQFCLANKAEKEEKNKGVVKLMNDEEQDHELKIC